MNNAHHISPTGKLLYPLSWIYSGGVWLRNKLFDCGILPVEEFPIPIISVGNITVGGTGKTPLIEYLIELLSPHTQVAVLSRGYRRKSHGYVVADENVTAQEIGDEPYQIHCKYPQVIVAVDANRRRGIKKLLQRSDAPGIILLDDAHQHRYVHPTLSIVLCDHNRPVYNDCMLPTGTLREPMSGLQRADIIILTKCTHTLTSEELCNEAEKLHIDASRLYTSHIEYGELQATFPLSHTTPCVPTLSQDSQVLLLAGIALPRPMYEYISQFTSHITTQYYPDHHPYTQRDIKSITQAITDNDNMLIITTEKDAARLRCKSLPEALKKRCYTLPLRTDIQSPLHNRPFNQIIMDTLNR